MLLPLDKSRSSLELLTIQSTLDSVISPCLTLTDMPPISSDPSGLADGTLTQSPSPVTYFHINKRTKMALNRSSAITGVIVQIVGVVEIQFESAWAITNINSRATYHV